MKSLTTVTDRFSLVDTIRKHTPQNGRKYVLESVRNTFNRADVKERIKLGEMYGYYGHGRRALYYNKAKKLNLPEVSVVMVEGKPVVLENVPSNRTLSVSIDDDGIVTHTQEILDTDSGRIVQGMHNSNAGGWSWATSGNDSALSLVTSFDGFDYVTTPNYISLDRASLMLESAEERDDELHAALVSQGYSEVAASDIVEHFKKLRSYQPMFETVHAMDLEGAMLSRDAEIEQLKQRVIEQSAMLENNTDVAKQRRRVLRNAVSELPIFISSEQRQALCRMETVEDAEIVAAMLESLGSDIAKGLPIGEVTTPAIASKKESGAPLVWLSKNKLR